MSQDERVLTAVPKEATFAPQELSANGRTKQALTAGDASRVSQLPQTLGCVK